MLRGGFVYKGQQKILGVIEFCYCDCNVSDLNSYMLKLIEPYTNTSKLNLLYVNLNILKIKLTIIAIICFTCLMHGFIKILKPKQMENAVIKLSILILCWLCNSNILNVQEIFQNLMPLIQHRNIISPDLSPLALLCSWLHQKQMSPDQWTFPFGLWLILNGSGAFYVLSCFPPNSCGRALTPEAQNMTIFGDRVFKIIIKLQWVPWSGP